MRKLALYDQTKLGSALNAEEPLPVNHKCERCELAAGAHTICMSAEGEAGADILLISEYPGRVEDDSGRPMTGVSGRYLRQLLQRWGIKSVAIDNAIKCAPGKTKVKSKHVKACRPYAADVARIVAPKRIVCLGGSALEGVLGRRPAVLSVRKGYSWHRVDGELVPVFFVPNPAAAMRNRFIRAAFEEDLKWALTCSAPQPKFGGWTMLVETPEDAAEAQRELLKAEWFAYDVETHGEMHDAGFRVECVSFAPVGKKIVYTWTREAMRDPECRAAAKALVERGKLVTQNGKFDDRAMLLDLAANAGVAYADTRLMSRMLDPAAAAKLDVIAERIGLGGHKEEAKKDTARVVKELNRQAKPPPPLTPKGNPRKIKPPAFPVPQVVLDKLRAGADPKAYMFGYTDAETTYRYNARDADVTRRYAVRVLPEFRSEPHISRMWDLVVRDANKAVRYIEHWGIGTDRDAVGAFASYCKLKIDDSRATLSRYGDFNPNAPQQLANVLFNKLKLPRIKLTQSGADSTDKEVLEELLEKTEHPIVPALIEYRRFSKLDSTYATGMLPHIRGDGRVHCSYLLDGAGTGRLSSRDPNMQNIPRAKGSDDAKLARNCFVAPKGYVILESDFSQLELRIAAMLSGDPAMIADFKAGIDIHSNNATELCELAFGIPRKKWDQMTKDERDPFRSRIKTTTFGKLYGKTVAGLAAEFGCSKAEVERINAKIWGKYKRLDAWCKQQIVQGRKTGEVWTWWAGEKGRRRPLWGIGDPDDGVRSNAENSCVNTPVQGTAADFCTSSLWPIVDWIVTEQAPAKLVATVHDSILIEVRKDWLAEVAAVVKSIMEGHESGGVPLVVDQKVGESWGSMNDYKAAA